MSAAFPLPAPDDATPDPLVLSAALEAWSGGFALLEQGRVEYASQAFAQAVGFCRGVDVRQAALSELLPEPPRRLAIVPEAAPQFSCSTFHACGRDWQVVSLRPSPPAPASQVPDRLRLEAVGRLVSGVAHDFNNLLTGMLLYCELLRSGLRGHPHLRRHVDEMHGAAERGATLIRQLLDVARPQPEQPEALSWNEAVGGLASFLRRLIGENLQLTTDLAADLCPVKMGPSQMQQVILNLVLNARDAMPAGGRITLATRNCGPVPENPGQESPGQEGPGMVELSVTDNGCGMDEDTRARLFEPFFTTKAPGLGNGIGLATVYNIVQKAQGMLQVESAPGKGTRVMIRLPRAVGKACQPEFITSFDSIPAGASSMDPNEFDPSQPRGNSV